ncbi:MAG TPA: phosphotransferase [Solirubrobacteraceae bacterium]|nr:phosphotransferase [Solirubrobacteraceae bacterium]
MSAPSDLAPLLDRLRPLLGPPAGAPEPLDGGITNRNFRVRLGGEDYVLRVCDRDAAVLGIDRTTEALAATRAAEAGIGPAVAAWLAEEGALVTRWLGGGGLTAAELRTPGPLAQVARALRAFHDGPPLPSAFAVFNLVESGGELVRRARGATPAGYERALAAVRRVRAALRGPEHAPAPCHNDLLAANFVCADGRVHIVDWEYAGMNDRFFDLGNLAVNNGFGADDERALLELYFGEPASEKRLAALRLMRIVSDFREAMWGAVQSVRSRIEFDYDGYAREHFARLLAAIEGGDLEDWLRAAAA